jgi:hypothetical protein
VNDKTRLPEDALVLGSLELQLRNLRSVQQRALPIVERLQGQLGLAEPTAEVLGLLLSCDLEAAIPAVGALRVAVERANR